MKRVLFSFFVCLGGVFSSIVGYGQTPSLYNFSAFSSPYVSIAGTGTPASISADDITQQNIPIGFTFNYCGTNYFQLAACSNGFLNFANSIDDPFTNILANIATTGWILPFWDDLHGGGHVAYYQTTGVAPNRIFTFEWNNFHHWSTGAAGGNANVQVKLYESSNVIDFCYGVFSLSWPSDPGATIGITNSGGTPGVNRRTLPNFGPSPAPVGPFQVIAAYPANNQVYRWSPCSATVSASNSGPVCPGGSVTLTGVAGGGATSYVWSGPGGFSSTSLVTTVSPAVAGTYTIVVSNGTCTTSTTTVVTVNPAPAAFTITPSVVTMCGPAQALNAPSAVVWTAVAGLYTDPGASTPYTAGSPVSTVYAAPAATTVYTATATLGSCTTRATATVNVSTAVLPVTGTPTVCVGSTTTLSSLTPGGVWTSSDGSVATVSGGVVTGVGLGASAGVVNITYTVGPCYAIRTVTVYPSPTAISPTPPSVCLSSTVTFTSTPAGGTWSASAGTGSVTVTAGGATTGSSLGTAGLTYTLATGCRSTAVVTVNPNPTPIVGPASMCIGTTTTFTSTPASGFWSITPGGPATVGVLSGEVTAGGPAGTTILTYTAGGCRAMLTITVVAAPGPITGPASVCAGSCATYVNSTAGGTWSNNFSGVGTIGASTGTYCGVSGGIDTIRYSLSPACYITRAVTVTATPPAPTGTMSVCVGATTTLSHVTPLGTWSASCPTILTVGLGTGVVTGVGAGTCVVTYTLPSGCIATTTVTVSDNPAGITGTLGVCQYATTTLGSSTPGGTWSSVTGAVGTIGSTSGILYGASGGTTTISYTLGTGCYTTATATVTAAPPAITGTFTVCAGSTTALTSGPVPPGFWGNTPTTTASVSGTGVVTGLAAGTTMVTYTTTTGCYDTAIVTIL
ncbi:hypothetical protein, partial [Nemorincola caseinilytica]|uniref:hypothetical protein n=1 Tax=Nemorincola caseinilytica TaxID=2054315 RepID=UPI0031E98597